MKGNKLLRISALGCTLTVILSGCGKNISDKRAEVEQVNDTLRICADEQVLSYLENGPLAEFRKENPSVKVEIQTVAVDESEKGKVEAALMAGDGSDLYIHPEMILSDFYKAQQTGAFEDLMPWFEREKDFNPDDYLEGTFDMYENTDACYIFPSRFSPNFYAIYKDEQDKLDIKKEDWADAAGFLKNIEKFCEAYPEDKPFLSIDAFIQGPTEYGMTSWKSQEENEKILIMPEIERTVNLYKKQVYVDGVNIVEEESQNYPADIKKAVNRTGHYMGLQIPIFSKLDYYLEMGGASTADIYAAKDAEGKSIGNAGLYDAAIASSSANKENAYKMIKYLMENAGRTGTVFTTKKDVNKDILQKIWKQYGSSEVLVEGKAYQGMDKSAFQVIEDTAVNGKVTGAAFDYMSGKFWEYMVPYLEDRKDYEDCLNEFESFMKIYYSE